MVAWIPPTPWGQLGTCLGPGLGGEVVLGFQAETRGAGGSEHCSIQTCRISGWQHQGAKWWLTSEQVAGQRGMHFAPKMFCTMTFFSTGRNYPKKTNYRNALFTAVLLQDETTGNNPSVHGPLEGRQPAHAPPAQTGDLLLVGDRVRGSVPPRVHAGQNVRRDRPEHVSACIFTNISGKRQKLRPGVAPRKGSRHGAGGNILTIFLFVSLRIKILIKRERRTNRHVSEQGPLGSQVGDRHRIT